MLVYTQKLAVMGQSVLQAVGGASWAALAELHAQGESETFNRRLVEMTRTGRRARRRSGWCRSSRTTGRSSGSGWRPRFPYAGDAVTVLAAVNAVLFSTQALWCWCFTATGKIRRVVPQVAAAAVVNLVDERR